MCLLLKVASNAAGQATITEPGNAADDENTSGTIGQTTTEAASSGNGNGADHNKHGNGYQVFHFDFEEVKLPWIISFWLLLASLSKIGKNYVLTTTIYIPCKL